MSVTLKLEGSDRLATALRKAGVEAQRDVEKAVVGTAIELRGDIVKRIQRGPATGRVYQKTSPRRTHQASAPGEAPSTDTGRLANSITFDKVAKMSATVGSKIVYAAALEFGTGSIRPRPAWVPSIEEITPEYVKRLQRALGEAFR